MNRQKMAEEHLAISAGNIAVSCGPSSLPGPWPNAQLRSNTRNPFSLFQSFLQASYPDDDMTPRQMSTAAGRCIINHTSDLSRSEAEMMRRMRGFQTIWGGEYPLELWSGTGCFKKALSQLVFDFAIVPKQSWVWQCGCGRGTDYFCYLGAGMVGSCEVGLWKSVVVETRDHGSPCSPSRSLEQVGTCR